jgi:phosphate butyryltransferase
MAFRLTPLAGMLKGNFMRIASFKDLLTVAREKGPRTVVAVGAHLKTIVEALGAAHSLGIANAVLIGDEPQIRNIASANEVDVSDSEIVHQPDPKSAARKCMVLVAEGRAHVAMKGRVDTTTFLRAALDKDLGLRTGQLLSHVAAFDIEHFERLIFISDAGVNIAPTLAQKADIIRNAVFVAHKLGIEMPRVAVLASNEVVNPKMPVNIEAAALAKMADRGQITGALVDGPLALDNAISIEAAGTKGIVGPVAGRADILIPPDIEAGNMLAKAIVYFAASPMAGVVVGARAPLIVASRSALYEDELNSIALGVIMSL